MAPAPGLEPGTKWLTATYSTIELCRSVVTLLNIPLIFALVNTSTQKKWIFSIQIPNVLIKPEFFNDFTGIFDKISRQWYIKMIQPYPKQRRCFL